MKWKRLGKIFDPAEHLLPVGGAGFAQSPQALVLADRVRVYFSTRELDVTGKYLSHVAYVDFDRQMKHILGLSEKPVIPLGELGCFDEHGIFPFSPFRDGDRILAYTTGWSRRVSVSVDGAIGLAVSFDGGVTFEKHGAGPIMASSLHEPFLVGDAFVTKYDDIFHMWYIYGLRWLKPSEAELPDRVYKITHAISENGVDWQRDGSLIIPDRIGVDECQALPTVIKLNNVYHMYFCFRSAHGFRENRDNSYRIGYAYSYDLKSWVRDDIQGGLGISDNGWDSQMLCYPHIFECEGKVFMLYNGNEFGRYGFGLAELVEDV